MAFLFFSETSRKFFFLPIPTKSFRRKDLVEGAGVSMGGEEEKEIGPSGCRRIGGEMPAAGKS